MRMYEPSGVQQCYMHKQGIRNGGTPGCMTKGLGGLLPYSVTWIVIQDNRL